MDDNLARRVAACTKIFSAAIRQDVYPRMVAALHSVDVNNAELLELAANIVVESLIRSPDREAEWIFFTQTVNNGVFLHDSTDAAGTAINALEPKGSS